MVHVEFVLQNSHKFVLYWAKSCSRKRSYERQVFRKMVNAGEQQPVIVSKTRDSYSQWDYRKLPILQLGLLMSDLCAQKSG